MGTGQDHEDDVTINVDHVDVVETVSKSSTNSHSSSDHVSARAIIHVTQGHQVFVKNAGSQTANLKGGLFMSFSGVLLKADEDTTVHYDSTDHHSTWRHQK